MRYLKAAVWAAIALGAVAALILAWAHIATWLAHVGGFRNGDGNSAWYLFPSGWGSIILPPVITIAGATAVWGWHNQCEVHRCHWVARRKTAAGARACWRHHPDGHLTAEQLRANHHLYLGRRPGRG